MGILSELKETVNHKLKLLSDPESDKTEQYWFAINSHKSHAALVDIFQALYRITSGEKHDLGECDVMHQDGTIDTEFQLIESLNLNAISSLIDKIQKQISSINLEKTTKVNYKGKQYIPIFPDDHLAENIGKYKRILISLSYTHNLEEHSRDSVLCSKKGVKYAIDGREPGTPLILVEVGSLNKIVDAERIEEIGRGSQHRC